MTGTAPIDHQAVYDVLVDVCGAPDTERDRFNFAHYFPECREFRFCGDLGFGGKVWCSYGDLYVTCYPEDSTPERQAMIEAANAQLAELARGS